MSSKGHKLIFGGPLKGWVGITPEEQQFLFDLLKGKRCYLEIGTAHGGTLAIATLAEVPLIISIDNYSGYSLDPDYVRENVRQYGGEPLLMRVNSRNHDFSSYRPCVSLIDGDHTYMGVKNDWAKVEPITSQYILFHDYDKKKWPSVVQAVEDIKGLDWDWKFSKGPGTFMVATRTAGPLFKE